MTDLLLLLSFFLGGCGVGGLIELRRSREYCKKYEAVLNDVIDDNVKLIQMVKDERRKRDDSDWWKDEDEMG